MVENITSNITIVVSATIVLYKENMEELSKTIKSFLETPLPKKLFLLDNSPTIAFKDKFKHPDIEYIFIEGNVGFGKAHNKIINRVKNFSKFHLILNPDVIFKSTVIPTLVNILKNDGDLALIAPKVVYPNGEHQYSCRRYPTFSELIIRRLTFLNSLFPSIIKKATLYLSFSNLGKTLTSSNSFLLSVSFCTFLD